MNNLVDTGKLLFNPSWGRKGLAGRESSNKIGIQYTFFSRSQLFESGWLDEPGLDPANNDGFVECGVLLKDNMLLS
jgi:hypothetical protein